MFNKQTSASLNFMLTAAAWQADADVWLQEKDVRFTFLFSLISPMIAAAAMATSSLLVVGNSLSAMSLRRYAREGERVRDVTRSLERRAK
jgi:cation transport ATPase